MKVSKKRVSRYDDKKKKKKVSLFNNLNMGSAMDMDIDKKKKKKGHADIESLGYADYYDAGDKDKKKKKKVLTMDLDKKKKKILAIAGIVPALLDTKTQKRLEPDSMKVKLCDIRYGNFLDIDVSDRTPYWGLGVEHEMQLFHKSRQGMKNTNILFDSQESACILTNDQDPAGACCKGKPGCDDFTEKVKKYGDFGFTEEERRFVLSTQWEMSGRQVKNCEKGKPLTTIIKRTPILMPELITTNFSNRTIDSIAKEMIDLENHYIDIHMKNPFVKQKVAKYGKLTTHLCGSHSDILIPLRPTINDKDYLFQNERMIDYLGSYHITLTLPHYRNIKTKDFVLMHQNMANQIQWLEPLILTGFFSPSPGAAGNRQEPEGSYRVMTIGWGNFAGSNIRNMGSKGLDRGSNVKSYWRNGLNFTGTKKLNYCAKNAPPQYKKSKSIHTGDFRTFGIETDMEKCKDLYNPNDCPRADGAPMRPPFGMEIRIFDHFPSQYLLDLMKIVVLIGCNSLRHPAKKYVYTNRQWIKATRSVMRDGWNARLEAGFINELRDNLGLAITTSSVMAFDVFKQVVAELHEVNKDAFFNKLMNENPDIAPRVPEINRMCWELGFIQKYNNQIIGFLKRHFRDGQTVSIEEFKKLLSKDKDIEYGKWKDDLNDMLYALETNNHVLLETFEGKIQKVKIML